MQQFKDYELIIMHDGPDLGGRDIRFNTRNMNIQICFTSKRTNKWGHDNRQRMIDMCKGEWILHTNTDNVYNLNILSQLNEAIREQPEIKIHVCPIEMMGLNFDMSTGIIWYDEDGRDYSKSVILSGREPTKEKIDLMQVVIHNSLWKKYGWYDTSVDSDGEIYESLCKKHKYKHHDFIIGKHF
jgi:hypothetical protein